MPSLKDLGNFIQQVGFPVALSIYLLYLEHRYVRQIATSLAVILEVLRRLEPQAAPAADSSAAVKRTA